VNRGVGNVALPIRWNAPPEVALLTLRSGAVVGAGGAREGGRAGG
jgi:hypothetical protein